MSQQLTVSATPNSDASRGVALIIDDDPTARRQIVDVLGEAGWETVEATSRDEALDICDRLEIDVVTLAISMTRESGYEICTALRMRSEVPIVFVTNRHDDFDHAFALNLGGDAYVTKPFNSQVLIAEVASSQRRGERAMRRREMQVGALVVDGAARRAAVSGRDVQLSKTEFDLLLALVRRAGAVVDHQTIVDEVWGAWFSDLHVVGVTVSRLRKKLASAGVRNLIEAVPGVGYRLEDASSRATS